MQSSGNTTANLLQPNSNMYQGAMAPGIQGYYGDIYGYCPRLVDQQRLLQNFQCSLTTARVVATSCRCQNTSNRRCYTNASYKCASSWHLTRQMQRHLTRALLQQNWQWITKASLRYCKDIQSLMQHRSTALAIKRKDMC